MPEIVFDETVVQNKIETPIKLFSNDLPYKLITDSKGEEIALKAILERTSALFVPAYQQKIVIPGGGFRVEDGLTTDIVNNLYYITLPSAELKSVILPSVYQRRAGPCISSTIVTAINALEVFAGRNNMELTTDNIWDLAIRLRERNGLQSHDIRDYNAPLSLRDAVAVFMQYYATSEIAETESRVQLSDEDMFELPVIHTPEGAKRKVELMLELLKDNKYEALFIGTGYHAKLLFKKNGVLYYYNPMVNGGKPKALSDPQIIDRISETISLGPVRENTRNYFVLLPK